jgi:hypothetical protein
VSELDPTPGADPARSDDALPPSGAGAPRPARKKAAKKRPAAGPGDGPRPPRTPPPVNDPQVTRNGIIVIAATLIIGVLIFVRGVNNQTRLDTQASVATTLPGIAGPPTTDRNQAPTTTVPGQGNAGTTKTDTTKVAPEDIKVIVANAVDPTLTIAGPVGTRLTDADYKVTSKIDITPLSDKTFVYYTEGFEAEARAMAKVLEYPESTVAPMPKTPPTPLNGAQILVAVGKDHAP